jgi:hypothetical protein
MGKFKNMKCNLLFIITAGREGSCFVSSVTEGKVSIHERSHGIHGRLEVFVLTLLVASPCMVSSSRELMLIVVRMGTREIS